MPYVDLILSQGIGPGVSSHPSDSQVYSILYVNMDYQCVSLVLLHASDLTEDFIANVSVCVFPIEVLPSFYRYGYAMPFYNISRAMRTIVFGTKNRGKIGTSHVTEDVDRT